MASASAEGDDLDPRDLDLAAIVAELAEALAPAGFDLVAHGTVAAYHAALGDRGDDQGLRLPEAPEGAPSRAVILVGNSRALWPVFKAALAADPARRAEPHPFDRWTAETLTRAVVGVVGWRCAFDLRFVFETGARAFSALHLAEACGLAYRGPAGLAVHPRLGPWFALRAAVVLALPGRAAPPPDPLCERCRDKPCLAALAKAMGAPDERWRAFLAVRDACPVGGGERYSDEQIRWHYAHDRSALA